MIKTVAITLAILTPSMAAADGYEGGYPSPSYSTPQTSSRSYSTRWGLVPGIRIGAVRGSFDGTIATPATQSAWGYTTELHLDLIRTFGNDRRAIGFSLGHLSQTHRPDDLMPSATDFEHSGTSATVFLSTVLSGRKSLAARVGIVGGETTTGLGAIDGNLKRFGLELTHVSTFAKLIDVATHVSAEYFTGGEERSYSALSLVLGATFAFGIF